MPRTGGVYAPPAGTKGIPNTTILSAPYNALVDDLTADANAARPITAGGTGATSASGARTALGLVIGTDVQAYDAGLKSIADLTTAPDQMMYATAADVYATTALTPFARTVLDDTDAAAMRTTLGLGALSVIGSPVPIANGGTGSTTAAAARAALGLGTAATVDSPVPVGNGGTGATNATNARANLGLGSIAILDTPLPVANGGTAATSVNGARINLGLGGLATLDIGDLVYSGGDNTNTNFPVTTTVGVHESTANRNAQATIYRNSGTSTGFTANVSNGAPGSALTGVWRQRGRTGEGGGFFYANYQRTS